MSNFSDVCCCLFWTPDPFVKYEKISGAGGFTLICVEQFYALFMFYADISSVGFGHLQRNVF
jgi:hypothetical protein